MTLNPNGLLLREITLFKISFILLTTLVTRGVIEESLAETLKLSKYFLTDQSSLCMTDLKFYDGFLRVHNFFRPSNYLSVHDVCTCTL